MGITSNKTNGLQSRNNNSEPTRFQTGCSGAGAVLSVLVLVVRYRSGLASPCSPGFVSAV
ncbi:UNVERIFIED_CONTAM: hypothetical protein FKN15_049887 [Acipenser sinensis]